MTTRRVLLGSFAALLLSACQASGPIAGSAQTSTAPVAAASQPSVAPPASTKPSETTAPTPTLAPSPTPVVEPPPPTSVRMKQKGVSPDADGYFTNIRTTITWKEAAAADTEIRIYGVTACYAPESGGPCLVEHTPLPETDRQLIATAKASKGAVSWTWPNWDDVGGAVMAHNSATYQALVIAAYNSAGHSKFIIIAAGEYCPDCVY
jgi:hypothetical protein